MRTIKQISFLIVVALASSTLANAQFPTDIFNKGKKGAEKAQKVADTLAEWTPEQEQAIGGASAAKLIHIFGLYDNPAMQHYVSNVGTAVASHSTRAGAVTYKFGILDTEAITAFGVPGGYVFVTRGALANMKNEAELAGTLAHEIAHVDNKHLEKEIRNRKAAGLVTEMGTPALDKLNSMGKGFIPVGSLLKDLANEIITQAVQMKYSRDKEDEADRKGTQLAAAAGYSATGLRDFLATIQQESQGDATAERKLGIWGSTHPPLAERVAKLTEASAQYSGGATLQARFAEDASFGPSKEELARMAAEKAAAEKAAAEKAAAEKAEAEKASKGKAKGKAKSKTK